jgi:hypothetical protein
VDAIRQVFIGSADPRVGVTVLGHTMTLGEEVVLIALFAIILITAASWSFNRQE